MFYIKKGKHFWSYAKYKKTSNTFRDSLYLDDDDFPEGKVIK